MTFNIPTIENYNFETANVASTQELFRRSQFLAQIYCFVKSAIQTKVIIIIIIIIIIITIIVIVVIVIVIVIVNFSTFLKTLFYYYVNNMFIYKVLIRIVKSL